MKSRRLAGFTLFIYSFVFLSVIAYGQRGETRKDFAEIANQGSSVSWRIAAPHKSVTLTVSAPNGQVYRQVFTEGTSPVFSPDFVYGDGSYTYEITVTPVISSDVENSMRAARRDGNSKEVAADLRKRGLLSEPMVQSGTFRVVSGQIFTKNDPSVEPEGQDQGPLARDGDRIPSGNKDKDEEPDFPRPSPEDQQILDDLIVDGSACIGFDCVNGESFGFDTLRLKENNLRLHFQDTSNSASFPSNDWRLTANDSTNGGKNKFSIDDVDGGRTPFTIEAGSPSNSLYVEDAGRIGLKTATPVVELHIADGDSPTVRLEQNGTSGFASQTWDIAGNETNFFVRDTSNGSKLPFRIFPGAPTDSLRIESNGDVTFKNGLTIGGEGTTTNAPDAAQQFYGGKAVLLGSPSSNIVTAIDTNSFGVTTNGQPGFASLLIEVPSNLNLGSQSAANIVYKIRYQDPDGGAAGSMVRLDLIANDISTGTRVTKLLFDSNTNPTSAENTVTVCQAVDTTYFNYATHGTHIYVVLIGTAALTAKFFQVQVYKINGSC